MRSTVRLPWSSCVWTAQGPIVCFTRNWTLEWWHCSNMTRRTQFAIRYLQSLSGSCLVASRNNRWKYCHQWLSVCEWVCVRLSGSHSWLAYNINVGVWLVSTVLLDSAVSFSSTARQCDQSLTSDILLCCQNISDLIQPYSLFSTFFI